MPETYQHWHVTLASVVDNMVLMEEDILHKRIYYRATHCVIEFINNNDQ